MKLRKLFAGVAAAATLLGGMAFGATTANAADTASITLSDKTVKGTVYTAYKIGSYDTASAKVENDKLASVGVTTDQAWKTDAENVLGTTVTNTPEYKGYGDPLAYVAGTTGYYTNTPGMLPNASATMESFVQGLTGRLDGKTAVDPSQTVANDNDDVVFSGLDEGLYLIVSKTDTEPVTDAGSPLAIVGTRVTVDGTAYTKLGANDQTLGEAVVKPSTPQKPSKSASDPNPYVGATITYTLEGTVPAKANSFKFVDTLSVGLTVKLDTLKVNVQGETDPLANTEYTVDPASGDFNTSAAKPSFTIALNDATKYQGKHIVVKYDALVNEKADVDGTDNDVRFDNSNQTATTTITPKLNTVTFTKKGVDADASALKGVVFQIVADANNATPLPCGHVLRSAERHVHHHREDPGRWLPDHRPAFVHSYRRERQGHQRHPDGCRRRPRDLRERLRQHRGEERQEDHPVAAHRCRRYRAVHRGRRAPRRCCRDRVRQVPFHQARTQRLIDVNIPMR